tara:strand:- start:3252 stop:3362 length:111 start_codon:yes stop_codon:yes gene_type:complete
MSIILTNIIILKLFFFKIKDLKNLLANFDYNKVYAL